MAEPLSQSVTFQALKARVTTLEEEGVPTLITSANIRAALGYTPANQAGDTFGGSITIANPQVTIQSGSQLPFIDLLNTGIVNWRLGNWGGVGGANNYFSLGFNASEMLRLDTDNTIRHFGTTILNTSGTHLELYGSDSPLIRARNAAGTQVGYIQWSAGQMVLETDTQVILAPAGVSEAYAASGGFRVTNVLTVGDANFGMSLNSGSPYVAFDSGDFLDYNRAGNVYSFNIGGSSALNVTSTSVTANGLSAPTISVDANFYAKLDSGSNPVLNFDTSDSAIHFSRAGGGSYYTFNIAGDQVLSLTTNYAFSEKPVFVGDTNFGLNYGSGLSVTYLALDANDTIAYTRSTNTLNFNIGGSSKAHINSSGLTASGSLTVDGSGGLLVTDGGTGKGALSLLPGDATHTGRVVFLDPAGSQQAAIGPDTATGPFGFINNVSAGFYFSGGVTQIQDGLHLYTGNVPVYADNTAATAGGLVAGDIYRTATGQLMIRY